MFGFVGSVLGQTLYSEDFTGQDGKGATGPGGNSPTIDLSGVDWTIDVSSSDLSATSDFFRVESGIFTGQDLDGFAEWISPDIDISGESNIEISLDVDGSSGFETADFIEAFYSIDSGAKTSFGKAEGGDIETTGSFSVSGLSGSSLKVYVQMDNNAGSEAITFDNVLVEVFSLKGEPTNQASTFSASSSSIENVNLSWTDASSGTLPDSYLILANDDNSFSAPSDGTSQSDDTDLSDGTGVLNIAQGTESASFSGLNSNTQYYFEIYSYTNSGSDIDYKTDSAPTANATTLEAPDLVLNEIFADPATDLTGDANGDGTRDASDDEFLEFVNTGSSDLTITGWTVDVGGSTEHTFTDPTVLSPMQGIVIFGGGTPTGDFGNSKVQTSSSGSIGLSNSGEIIEVKNGSNTLINYEYSGASDQSETRNPDLTGSFADHSTADTDDGSLFSPGTRLDGSTFQPSLEIAGTEGWRIMSTPTSGNTYDDLLSDIWTQGISTGADASSGTPNVQTFNGSDFSGISDMGTTMNVGEGFIVYVYSDDDHTESGDDAGFPKHLDLFGNENTGSVSPTLTSGADEWTLVGNPYNSTIDWDDLTKTDLTGTVYVYDYSYGTIDGGGDDVAANDPPGGGYRTWNGSEAGSLTGGLIAPFQGFWVQNSTGATSEALTIEEADQTTGGTFYKDTEDQSITIKMRGEMDNMFSEAYLSFTENGEVEKDNFDGLKLSPLDFRDYLSVATLTGDTKLDINNLPKELENEIEVPVSVEAFTADSESQTWVTTNGAIELSWPEMTNIPDNWSVLLNDLETGESIDMLESESYSFVIEGNQQKAKSSPQMTILNPQPPQAEVARKADAQDPRFTVTIMEKTGVSNEPNENPVSFALEQNYPNPFNPTTSIRYSVVEPGNVTLEVYNIAGQRVETLVRERKSAGTYQVSWNASSMASGVYYYRLQAGNEVLTRKMTLIK